MTTSARNKDLIQSVIDAVMTAIGEFCKHEALQYTWMRYLPRDGTHHWDPFWKGLVDGIKSRLQEQHILRTRGKGVLCRIGDLRYLQNNSRDQDGDPLFEDLDPEMYVADSYAPGDVKTLRDHGLKPLAMTQIMRTICQDLEKSGASSRLRSPRTDDDWHSRAASLLLLPFNMNWSDRIAEVRRLNVIPLQDGSWVSANKGDIFYDSVDGIPIPKDLLLQIVDPKATGNERRVELFNILGVRTASISMVRSRILALHVQAEKGDIAFEHSLAHLRFLYLTHESKSEDEDLPELVIYDHLQEPRSLLNYDFYIQDDHPYGAESLLGADSISSFRAGFVNPKYFEQAPKTPSGMTLTWVQWMYGYVGVRDDIRLLSRDKKSLSKECKHVAEHQNHKFLGFLKHVWPRQWVAMPNPNDIRRELRSIYVPCIHGEKAFLSACYMPLAELRSVQSRFTDKGILPFLDILSSDDASLLSEWSFLTKDVLVYFKNDLEFRLNLLEAFGCEAGSRLTTQEASGLLNLYQYIEAWCMGSENPGEMRGQV